jgi:DNA-binding XRE family transcriptional regulator
MLLGRISKAEGKLWLAECEALDGLTQGRSRKDACVMLADLVDTMVGRSGFKATATEIGPLNDGFAVIVDANDRSLLAAEVVKQQRYKHRRSAESVAKAIGVSNRSYAQYERGQKQLSLERLGEILDEVAPELAFTLAPRSRRNSARFTKPAKTSARSRRSRASHARAA